jgi:hypothetical protein
MLLRLVSQACQVATRCLDQTHSLRYMTTSSFKFVNSAVVTTSEDPLCNNSRGKHAAVEVLAGSNGMVRSAHECSCACLDTSYIYILPLLKVFLLGVIWSCSEMAGL